MIVVEDVWSKDVGTTGSIPVDIAKMRGILKAKQGILLRINHSFSNITNIRGVGV